MHITLSFLDMDFNSTVSYFAGESVVHSKRQRRFVYSTFIFV